MRVRIDAHSDANELDTNKAQVQPSPHWLFLLGARPANTRTTCSKYAHDLLQPRAIWLLLTTSITARAEQRMATRITVSALLLLLLVIVLNANAAVAQEGELKIEKKDKSVKDKNEAEDELELKLEIEGDMYVPFLLDCFHHHRDRVLCYLSA